MAKIIKPEFYRRPTLAVAQDLLGKFLVKQNSGVGGRPISRMITEVEAYDGPADLASHAAVGRRTKRTEIMYGPGGFWYIYFVYGMYHMLNVVTGPADYPAAVLIRSVAEVAGPGRLTKFFGINRQFNQKPVSRSTGLFIEDREQLIKPAVIKKSARIGVDYAGPVWSRKKYRFFLSDLVR